MRLQSACANLKNGHQGAPPHKGIVTALSFGATLGASRLYTFARSTLTSAPLRFETFARLSAGGLARVQLGLATARLAQARLAKARLAASGFSRFKARLG